MNKINEVLIKLGKFLYEQDKHIMYEILPKCYTKPPCILHEEKSTFKRGYIYNYLLKMIKISRYSLFFYLDIAKVL